MRFVHPKKSKVPSAIVKPVVSVRRPFCGSCGAPSDSLKCGPCARAFREWVRNNAEQPGGREGAGGLD